MNKIISLILILTLFLPVLVGCSNGYKPVESTREESRVIFTISYGRDDYRIKYELYRAFFLNYKSVVDQGDESVWTGDGKEEYINKINELIIESVSDIYAAFSLADELGIDPYSNEIEDQISEYVKISVDGNGSISGFGGNYDAYLESLKKQNLNYSASVTLIRYSIVLSLLNEYFVGYEDSILGQIPGEHSFTEGDVREFYFSDDCARVLSAYMQDGITADTAARVEKMHSDISVMTDDKDVALYIINHTSATPADLIVDKEVSGTVIGRLTLGDRLYSDYINAAFSLKPGEVSDIIEIYDGVKGYFLLYGLDKTEDHFDRCYEDVKLAYLENLLFERLSQIADDLSLSVKYSANYNSIDHSEISMD